jgi:hypothetical protein
MERKKTSAAIIFILMVFLAHSAWGASAVPVSPGNAAGTAVTDQVCPAFSWSAAEGAVSYWIEVYEQAAAGVLPYDQMSALAAPVRVGDIPAPALSWTPPMGECLDRGVKYVWYVIGVDRENYGDWSEGKAFQVDSSSLSVDQKEAVHEAVRTYLREDAGVCTSETNTVYQGPMMMNSNDGISGNNSQTKGDGERIIEQQSLSGIPGVEIHNTLKIPFASGTTQLIIGDANYSQWTSAPNISIGSSTRESVIYIGQSTDNKGYISWNYSSTPSIASFSIGTYSGANPLILQSHGGNVGIGTWSPTQKLDVAGTVKARNFIGAVKSAFSTSAYITTIATTCTNYPGGQVTITVPGAGVVMVDADADLYLRHANGTRDFAVIFIGSTATDCVETGYRPMPVEIPLAYPTGYSRHSVRVMRNFNVASEGTYTYYLNGQMLAGQDPDDRFWFSAMRAVFYGQ